MIFLRLPPPAICGSKVIWIRVCIQNISLTILTLIRFPAQKGLRIGVAKIINAHPLKIHSLDNDETTVSHSDRQRIKIRVKLLTGFITLVVSWFYEAKYEFL